MFPHSPKMNLFHTPYRQGFPCQHDFFIFSSRCEREHVGPARWPPDTLQPPFSLQHVPDATLVAVFYAKVSLSFGFQTACHPQPMSGRCSHFSFIFYDSLFDPLLFCLTCCHCGQVYLRTAHDPASYKIECAEMFCVL